MSLDISITTEQRERLEQDLAAVDSKLVPLMKLFAKVHDSQEMLERLKTAVKNHEDAAWVREVWLPYARRWANWLDHIEEATK